MGNGATIRQQMQELLSRQEATALELSQLLGIPEREVAGHLEHLDRSLLARGLKLDLIPSRCLKCGYTFRGRRRFTRPGRCPSCRSTRLAPPSFRVL